MNRLLKLAATMDYDVLTICGKGIGLDGILGFFLPEVGDFITFFVSLYTLASFFVHFRPVFWKNWWTMFMNIFIDLLFGLIPFAGDLFDVYWHSYSKNINIVRKYYGLEPIDEWTKKKDEEEEQDGTTPGADVETGAKK